MIIKHFDVRPRYSGGSPAMVDESTARRVAAQEQRAIKGYLEGIYGDDAADTAKQMGLAWIVWSWTERGNTIVREDLITGDRLTVKMSRKSVHTAVPIYTSDQPDFYKVQQLLRSYGIDFEVWDGQHREGDDEFSYRSFQWIVISNIYRKSAEEALAARMNLKPMPPYFRNRPMNLDAIV